ncbi:MAG TPA: GAF domain-containing protein, partial [Solirubrobacteraceae bacterium]|nr:GAF domain-containing protein [Solirubrobacteraceae bacterium]
GGWDVAVAWCPDERSSVLRCLAMWMAAPDRHTLFETSTWQRRLSLTASQVGRAVGRDHARWIADLTAADDPQLASAAGEGMHAALLIPIRHGEETSGVLELLTTASSAIDPDVATALESVALQLAHFEHLLRRSAEPRWRMGRL